MWKVERSGGWGTVRSIKNSHIRDDFQFMKRANAATKQAGGSTLCTVLSGERQYVLFYFPLPPAAFVRNIRLVKFPYAPVRTVPVADSIRVSGPPPSDNLKRPDSLVWAISKEYGWEHFVNNPVVPKQFFTHWKPSVSKVVDMVCRFDPWIRCRSGKPYKEAFYNRIEAIEFALILPHEYNLGSCAEPSAEIEYECWSEQHYGFPF